jgi:hypothetical protein
MRFPSCSRSIALFPLLKLFLLKTNLLKGIAQGFRRLATFSGLILGPIWGGATLHQPYLQMSIPLLLLILLGVSYYLNVFKTKPLTDTFLFFIDLVFFLIQED